MTSDFVLMYYTGSKYIGMKKQHFKLFDTIGEMSQFIFENDIMDYEVYYKYLHFTIHD